MTHHGMRFNEIFPISFEHQLRRLGASSLSRICSRSGVEWSSSARHAIRTWISQIDRDARSARRASCLRARSGGLGAGGFAQVLDYLLGKFLCRGRNVKMRSRENVGPEAIGGEFLP